LGSAANALNLRRTNDATAFGSAPFEIQIKVNDGRSA